MGSEPPIGDFVAGGYLLARPWAPPPDRHERLLPGGLIPTFAEALQVASCCEQDAGREPGVYRAWALVAYDALG